MAKKDHLKKAEKALKNKKGIKKLAEHMITEVIKDQEKQAEKQAEQTEGIEKALIPKKDEFEHFISKIKQPKPLSSGLEQTVGNRPIIFEEETEEANKKPYQEKKQEYQTQTPAQKAGADYVAEVAPHPLDQFKPSKTGRTPIARPFKAEMDESMRKAMKPDLYDTTEVKSGYQTPEFVKQAPQKVYTPFEEEKKERKKLIR